MTAMERDSERVEYQVSIRPDDDGSLWAEVTELPGCFASGADLDELQLNLAEAIGLYLSTPATQVMIQVETIEPVEEVTHQRFKVLV